MKKTEYAAETFREHQDVNEAITGTAAGRPMEGADNHLLLIGTLQAIRELRTRAIAGDKEAARDLLLASCFGCDALLHAAAGNQEAVKHSTRFFQKLPMNVHRSWIKQDKSLSATLSLFDKLEVGRLGTFNHLRMSASMAETPAKQWAHLLIIRMNELRSNLPLVPQLCSAMQLDEWQKAALALPRLNKDTAGQWFEFIKSDLPEDIYKRPEWATIKKDKSIPHPADKRHTIFLRIKQAMITLAAESI